MDIPPELDGLREGPLPTIIPLCETDVVQRYARDRQARISMIDAMVYFARAKQFTPRAPFTTSGTKAGGDLTLTLALAAASGTAQGNKYLLSFFLFEVMTSLNIAAGLVQVNFTGTFEDGQPWSMTGVELVQRRPGYSAFLVLPTRELDGAALPSLVELSRDYTVSGPGVAIPLTAGGAPNDATSITPTNGIRTPQRDVAAVIQAAPTNSEFRFGTLSPVHEFWNAPLLALHRARKGG
jgi:hypothetical protein